VWAHGKPQNLLPTAHPVPPHDLIGTGLDPRAGQRVRGLPARERSLRTPRSGLMAAVIFEPALRRSGRPPGLRTDPWNR